MIIRKSRIALLSLLCLCLMIPLLMAGCGEKEPVQSNAVVSAVPTAKGDLTVKATLTDTFLEAYTEKKVYLFEIPSAYTSDVDLEELIPVAEAKPKSHMTFELSLYDGVRSRLYSSFLLAAHNPTDGSYQALTAPLSVSDFSKISGKPTESVKHTSIKGLISDHPADALRLGISHTVVDVHMDKLILKGWQEGAVTYVYNGVTAYLDGEEIARLDKTVKAYTSGGVNVYLRFLLGGTPKETTPAGLYMPMDASLKTAELYAVNMASPETAEIMEGFFDFMAGRYATPEDGSMPVTSFVVGYRVNDAATYNCAGELPLASYVANYEKLVRVAHTAIKSHNPDGHVYVSLDSHRSSTGMEGGWDTPSFLSALNDECALRGNYDWYVACDLYADTPDIWVENAELDAARYTVHSIRTLTDLLVSDKYRTPDGKERKLLISGFAIPAVVQGGIPSEGNDAKQSASYAYAYMTCVQNGYVEALVYSAYADTDQNGNYEAQYGLWTLNELGDRVVISEKRPLYDLFKKIDTSDAPTLSGELTALIDEPYTKLERALAGQTQPVTVVTGETALEGYGTGYHKTTTLYSFGEGTLHGFGDAGELSYLALVKAETLGTQNLHAAFERDEICDPMGIFVTLPASRLLGGRELLMDLYAGADAENAGRPEVTVRLTSPATEDRGTVIYEATATEVRDGVWQTAVFDIEDFTASLSRDDQVILTVLMDYPPESAMYEDAHMGISQISVTGKTGGGQMAPWLIITLIAVPCVLVVGGFVVLLVIRRRRRW